MISANELKSLREQFCYTQLQMAQLLHCSVRMYQRYEWGKAEMPEALEELLEYKLKDLKDANDEMV